MSKKIQNNNISPASTQAQAKSANGFRYRLTRTVASSALVGALFGIIVGYAGGYLTTMGNNNQNKASASRRTLASKGEDTEKYSFAQVNPWPNRSKIIYKRDAANPDKVSYELKSSVCSQISNIGAFKSTTNDGKATFISDRPVTLVVECAQFKSQAPGDPEDAVKAGEFYLNTILNSAEMNSMNSVEPFSKAIDGIKPFIIRYSRADNHETMKVSGIKKYFGETRLNNADLSDDSDSSVARKRAKNPFTILEYSYDPRAGRFEYQAKTRDIRCAEILSTDLNVVTTSRGPSGRYPGKRKLGIRKALEITLNCKPSPSGASFKRGNEASDYISSQKMRVKNVPKGYDYEGLKTAFHVGSVKTEFFKDPNPFIALRINPMEDDDISDPTGTYKIISRTIGDYKNIGVKYNMFGDNKSADDRNDTLSLRVRNPYCEQGGLSVNKLNALQMNQKYGEVTKKVGGKDVDFRDFGYEVIMNCRKRTESGIGMFYEKTINIASSGSDTSRLALNKRQIKQLNDNKERFADYFKFITLPSKNLKIVENSKRSSGFLSISQTPVKLGKAGEQLSEDDGYPVISTKVKFKNDKVTLKNVLVDSNCREVTASDEAPVVEFANNQPKFIFKFVCRGRLDSKALYISTSKVTIDRVNIKNLIDTNVDNENSINNDDKVPFKQEMYKKFNLDPKSFVEFQIVRE